MARHIYLRPNVGVGAIRKVYGRAKRNGTRPNHFCLGSASVARKVFQSLEGIKIITKDSTTGRSLTSTGRRDMDRIAGQVIILLWSIFLSFFLFECKIKNISCVVKMLINYSNQWNALMSETFAV